MKIREATKFDLPKVIDLINDFYNEIELDLKSYGELNLEYVNKLYHHIVLGGGVAIVAEHGDTLVGIILAIKNPNVFYPDKIVMNELLIYVNPSHRKSSACYKMLLKYKEIGEQLIKDEKITTFTVTKTEQLDQIKLDPVPTSTENGFWVAGL